MKLKKEIEKIDWYQQGGEGKPIYGLSPLNGAFTIMNYLPVFEQDYTNPTGIAWISNTYQESDKVRYSISSPGKNLCGELDAAIDMFKKADFEEIQ